MATVPVNNPQIPFLGEIPGGFHAGMILRIRGQILGFNNWCQLFIQQGPALKPLDNVMLHLSIRPENNTIVRNHYYNKQWGNEEKSGQSPIVPNQPFEILILADPEQYKIAVNGQHFCEFIHRLPLNLAKFISIEGACEINYILVENDVRANIASQQYIQPSAPSMPLPDINPSFNRMPSISSSMVHPPSHPIYLSGPDVPISSLFNQVPVQAHPIAVVRPSRNKISYNPVIPFSCPIEGAMRPGMMIMIKGLIMQNNGRCSINIQDSPIHTNNEKIILHLSIRLDEDEIVRNHYNNVWGREERHGDNPIEARETFEILIMAEPSQYKIAVNGKHFCAFNHRMPWNMGMFLYVNGDCQIQEAQVVVEGNY